MCEILGRSSRTKVTNSALPSTPPLRGVSTTDKSAVTPVRVRTPVVLKSRKVSLATQTVDATTRGRPLALRRSRRTTAERKPDSSWKQQKRSPSLCQNLNLQVQSQKVKTTTPEARAIKSLASNKAPGPG